jgi:L-seryl-tRNA(Ser) seleniumtransferase
MKQDSDLYKALPGVDTLLGTPEIKLYVTTYSRELVRYAIREVLERHRGEVKKTKQPPSLPVIIEGVRSEILKITRRSLRPVINATGIIVHTNIGRAPLGEEMLREVNDVLRGYNNLEFDLQKGSRGSRNLHVAGMLKYLTGAEDILIVNNNAAAIMLILRTLARSREVVISRGELIEIGGSFRLPDIMKASDCIITEVGTTNKTSIGDYARAITGNTALLLKAHKSNYVIKGFTGEATLPELVTLGKKHRLPVVYDMGSGLLRKAPVALLHGEPDVRQTLATGVDLVCFSGDKLLGGPQAGIIAGRKKLVSRLKEEPLVRALRVGKTTLAMLEATCMHHLDDKTLQEKNPVFRMMCRTADELKNNALRLQALLNAYGIETSIVNSQGQSGGGSLPGIDIASFAVMLTPPQKTHKIKPDLAARMHAAMLDHDPPVLGILRKGHLLFDVLTIPDKELDVVASTIHDVHQALG